MRLDMEAAAAEPTTEPSVSLEQQQRRSAPLPGVLLLSSSWEEGQQMLERLLAAQGSWSVLRARTFWEALDLAKGAQLQLVVLDLDTSRPSHGDLEALLGSGLGKDSVPLVTVVGSRGAAVQQPAMQFALGHLTKDTVTEEALEAGLDHALELSRLRRLVDVQAEELKRLRTAQLEERDRALFHAHELLTPLAAIQEFVSLVLDGVSGRLNGDQGKHLAYARGACVTIQRSVDAMLAQAETGVTADEDQRRH